MNIFNIVFLKKKIYDKIGVVDGNDGSRRRVKKMARVKEDKTFLGLRIPVDLNNVVDDIVRMSQQAERLRERGYEIDLPIFPNKTTFTLEAMRLLALEMIEQLRAVEALKPLVGVMIDPNLPGLQKSYAEGSEGDGET